MRYARRPRSNPSPSNRSARDGTPHSALGIAAVGLLGAVLGAWINQHGARGTAERTLEGQRTLARDQAVRVWRADHVGKPLLEAAYERRGVCLELVQAADQLRQEPDEDRKAAWHTESIQRLYTALLREKKVANIAYRSVETGTFSAAVATLSKADGRCVDAAAAVLGGYTDLETKPTMQAITFEAIQAVDQEFVTLLSGAMRIDL